MACRDAHDREIETVIATRAPIRGEVPFVGTGGRRVYDYIFVPVFGAGGEVVAVAGTTRDITDRQQAEQSIREQAARLAEADRAKDEFLATLSHELRNPLAPLRDSLACLLYMSGAADAEGSARARDDGAADQSSWCALVDDLLEMSRISRGAFALRNERVEVAAIVRNAVETSQPLIDAAKHELKVSLPAGTLWVEGDPVRAMRKSWRICSTMPACKHRRWRTHRDRSAAVTTTTSSDRCARQRHRHSARRAAAHVRNVQPRR